MQTGIPNREDRVNPNPRYVLKLGWPITFSADSPNVAPFGGVDEYLAKRGISYVDASVGTGLDGTNPMEPLADRNAMPPDGHDLHHLLPDDANRLRETRKNRDREQ